MEKNQALFNYLLRLGDNAAILGHKLSEWCGHGPELEEDIAIINTALDLLGHARSIYSYAGEVEGKGRTEDDLAYLRIEREYRNALICELPNGNYGDTIARQYLVDQFNFLLFSELVNSKDETVAAISEKTIKEIRYHLRRSKEWVLRLGDGTEESHNKIQEAFDNIWPYTGDLFVEDQSDAVIVAEGIGPDMKAIHGTWRENVKATLAEATLTIPKDGWMHSGSKAGRHTEHMGYILAELQYMQRTYPGCEW
ncbi:MAG: phenylacetate-CoA oxygenase subunit PaaC [Flavobacteriales bacterium]|nr:phenylacetate-CoA oxygenase subunit PaaC [Flavobacteriales bacterium]